ncbi:MAG: type I secretion system permease/ATPase [Methylophilaceae bacterium]|nr:MAG: type I secretion system permease/ATPase [Methylophilaceae bacterium]
MNNIDQTTPLEPELSHTDYAFEEMIENLAVLLSKISTHQGISTPTHRFSMMDKTQDGVALKDLSLAEQAQAMWLSRFKHGLVSELTFDALSRKDFPILWVSQAQDESLLIKGRLSNGKLACEDVAGSARELEPDGILNGNLLRFKTEQLDADDQIVFPVTARDWFSYTLRKHRRIFGEAIFATFMISSVGLFSAMYTMQVYDRVVPTKGYSTLWVLTIGVVIGVLIEFTIKQVRARMLDRTSKAIDLELSSVFFGKAMDIRMDARPKTVGTFASQIRHFESVRNFMASSTLYILADVPFAVLFIGVIAFLAGPIAVVPIISLCLSLISGFYSQKEIEQLTQENMTESNKKNGLLIDSIDGIESIKASGGEWKMLDKYQSLTNTMAKNELALKFISTRAANMAQSIQQFNYICIIAVGALLIGNGDLSMGALIACSIISGRVFNPITQLPNMIMQWKNAIIALKSLDDIMSMPSDRSHDQRLVIPESCKGKLQLQDVSFSYQEDMLSIEIENLVFQPGERVAIIGAVGSGKSTLIKMLSGLYKPQKGTVFLDDIDIYQLAPEFVREHIGYLPQDVRLFNGTLRENLTIGMPTPSDSKILEAASLTGLDNPIRQHPKGLELEISEGGRGLSGGQRQLVGLTRLLIAKPKVILLDEPTASMDMQLESKVMKHLFEKIPKDHLIIVVTHKFSLLPKVDRVIVIDNGKIAIDGPKEKVLSMFKNVKDKNTQEQNKATIQTESAPVDLTQPNTTLDIKKKKVS